MNVEVLGHLFEKSVAELEKIRAAGLFGIAGPRPEPEGPSPVMPKSAERKRFGIYYTPPEFTDLIVRETVEKAIDERLERGPRSRTAWTTAEANRQNPLPKVAAYLARLLRRPARDQGLRPGLRQRGVSHPGLRRDGSRLHQSRGPL